jgi:hypothetical protein
MTQDSRWTFAGNPASLANRTVGVTLVAGTSFCVSGETGDLVPGTTEFRPVLRDTCFLRGDARQWAGASRRRRYSERAFERTASVSA